MRRQPDALDGNHFDLVLLGGGITGAGTALDAALRGLRVALIDRGDFASGTSSISSKLIHGGLRYLEQGDLTLVYEALRERGRLLRNAPHLVRPLRFLLPLYSNSRVPPWKWRLGLQLYDLLAGRGNLQRSCSRTLSWVRARFPTLRPHLLQGAAEYSDAQMDDARLCIAVLRSASLHGATLCNYVEAARIAGDTIHAVDHLTGRELRFRARVIVNATGPWSDHVRTLAGEDLEPLLAPTRGVHLIAPECGLTHALLLLHPRDGRVFFVLPWLGKTLIGTTDTDSLGLPDEQIVTTEDIDYLLEGFNAYFHDTLERSMLLGHFIGVRPLARFRKGDPSDRSREWRLVEGTSGMLTVIGGKYTTYRHMAEKITDVVVRRLGRAIPCRTRAFRLDGTPVGDWSEYEPAAVARLTRDLGFSPATALHLVRRYGGQVNDVIAPIGLQPQLAQPILPGEPDIRAELLYQRHYEMACRPDDFLLRRTRLGLFHPDLLASREFEKLGLG